MNINIDDTRYKVKRKQVTSDSYQYLITPKKRNCKLCKRVFESVGNEFITWTDDNGYLRSGYFCRKDFVLIKKALKLIKECK